MKVIGFAGSTSKTSINKALVELTLNKVERTDTSIKTELLDLNDYELPLFSVDREEEGFPENVERFIQKIQSADALVISMAEHNGAYSAAAKNLIDWCSRKQIDFFQNIPVLLMATSPGGYGGGNVLELAKKRFPKFKASIVATYKLPSFGDNFDREKGIIQSEEETVHQRAVIRLIEELR
ncbi:MAG: NADPH-dependent FMN reductase [Bacteroidota bacterium]